MALFGSAMLSPKTYSCPLSVLRTPCHLTPSTSDVRNAMHSASLCEHSLTTSVHVAPWHHSASHLIRSLDFILLSLSTRDFKSVVYSVFSASRRCAKPSQFLVVILGVVRFACCSNILTLHIRSSFVSTKYPNNYSFRFLLFKSLGNSLGWA